MKILLSTIFIFFPIFSFAQPWVPAGPLSSATDYVKAMTDDGNGTIVAASWAVGIYRSTDNGNSWQTTSFSASNPRIYKMDTDPAGYFYALANSTSSITMQRSTDGGSNWEQVFFESRANNFATGGGIVFLDSVNFIAGLSFTIGPTIGDIAARIIKSTDGGVTWSNITIIGAGFLNDLVLADNGKLYGGTSLGGIIVSTNNGVNWNTTSFTPYVSSMEKNSEGVLYAGSSNVSGNSVWKSTDNGATWLPLGVGENTIRTMYIDDDDVIYVSNNNNNLYRSINGGNNWTLFETGLPSNQTVYSFSGNTSKVVFAGTGSGGVYRNGIISSVISGNETPESFQLKQNYPNPFNPSTNINFSLNESGFTSLKVYDIYGRQVDELVNSSLSKGNYSIQFDASAITSGTYFYRLTFSNGVTNISETKKMLLVK